MSALATQAKTSGSVKWLKTAIAAAFIACFAFLTLGGVSAQQALAATAENDITVSIVGTDGQTEETKYTVTADQLDQLAVTDGEAVAQYYKGGKWTVLYSTNYVLVSDILEQAGVTVNKDDVINFGASDGINKKWSGATLSELEAGQFYPNYDAGTSAAGDGGYAVPPALALTYATGTGSTPAEALENAKAAAQETVSCPRSFMGVLSDNTVGGNRLWSGVTFVQIAQKTCTVSYQANGGSVIDAQKVEYGTTLAQPAAPNRDGYTFGGWYTDKALTSAYDFSAGVAGNITLYAKWTKNAATPVPSQKVTGLAVGKSATAGSGASKAIYKATGANTVTYVVSKASTKTITVPATVKINGKTYKVTNVASNAFKGKKATKINLNKYVTAVTAKMFNGAKKVKTVVLGAKVKKIAAKAFKSNTALKTLTVKTKQLTKKSVKNSLKSSKVKTVKVNVGKISVDKKYVKKYAKIFTKANAGKKVTVKR